MTLTLMASHLIVIESLRFTISMRTGNDPLVSTRTCPILFEKGRTRTLDRFLF